MSSGKRIPRRGALTRRNLRNRSVPQLCGRCGHLAHGDWCNYQPSVCDCPGEDA